MAETGGRNYDDGQESGSAVEAGGDTEEQARSPAPALSPKKLHQVNPEKEMCATS